MIDSIALWTVALAVYSWFATWTGFFVIASASRVRDAGIKFPFGGWLVIIFWIVVAVPGDAVYNAIIGSYQFREWPKWHRGEFMYTHRIERHANKSSGWRREKAYPLALLLNAVEPGHVDL